MGKLSIITLPIIENFCVNYVKVQLSLKTPSEPRQLEHLKYFNTHTDLIIFPAFNHFVELGRGRV